MEIASLDLACYALPRMMSQPGHGNFKQMRRYCEHRFRAIPTEDLARLQTAWALRTDRAFEPRFRRKSEYGRYVETHGERRDGLVRETEAGTAKVKSSQEAVHESLGGIKPSPCRDPGPCVVVPIELNSIELNGEPGDEIVILIREEKRTYFDSFRAIGDERGWERYAYMRYETRGEEVDAEKLAAALLAGRFNTRRTQRRDLEVEGVWFLLDF